jgi:glucokinase
MHVLAADVGGTKTVAAIVEIEAKSLSLVRQRRYVSAEHRSLGDLLEDFLADAGPAPRFAGAGVAGPVRQRRAHVTKLPWNIDERSLERRFPKTSFRLVNDFVANALGLPYLRPRQVRTIARGDPERGGPIALLGAGTGLGEGALLSVAGRYEPFASEGGHKDFSARDDRESRFAAFLRQRIGRAEWDRVLSGEGIRLLYDFFAAETGVAGSAEVERAFAAEPDRAAVITRFGLANADPLCRQALDLFVSLYGSEAGNVALQYRATGGVFVAGGIAPKILPAIERGEFVASFREKPPLSEFLSRVPIRVVLEPLLGLFGAAAAAYRIAIDATRPFSKKTLRLTTR